MRIELLVRQYSRMIGLARYTASLQKYLGRAQVDFATVEPGYPLPVRLAGGVLRPFGYDVRTFFANFPVAAQLSKGAVKHFTTQMMASLLTFNPRLSPVVVTVHDIVPYLMRDDPLQRTYGHAVERYFDNLAMHNLQRADRIIAVSGYTREVLIEKLACSPERVRAVLLGLDHETFRPMHCSAEFRARYGLNDQCQHILYVGSENPRKNLPRLLEAFAQLHSQCPRTRLLKVGISDFPEQHRQLVEQIRGLGLEDAVRFVDHVPQEDLVALYSAADLFVFPSLYEGFGLPPLEAMACGAPVVCSNAASLVEVVGDAAMTFDPTDVDALAQAMLQVLSDADLQLNLRSKGTARAAQFTWERMVQETIAVYREVCA